MVFSSQMTSSTGILLVRTKAKVNGFKKGLFLKDGAYYCYCVYLLCISRYSGFLRVVTPNTGIFLRGLKLYGENRT